jgi:hypothetical protein
MELRKLGSMAKCRRWNGLGNERLRPRIRHEEKKEEKREDEIKVSI